MFGLTAPQKAVRRSGKKNTPPPEWQGAWFTLENVSLKPGGLMNEILPPYLLSAVETSGRKPSAY